MPSQCEWLAKPSSLNGKAIRFLQPGAIAGNRPRKESPPTTEGRRLDLCPTSGTQPMFAPAMFTPSIQLNENLPTDSPLYITVNHQRCVYPSAFTRFVSRFPTDHSCKPNVSPLLRQKILLPVLALGARRGSSSTRCIMAWMFVIMKPWSVHHVKKLHLRYFSGTAAKRK